MIWDLSKSKIAGGKILVPLQLITLFKNCFKKCVFCTHISQINKNICLGHQNLITEKGQVYLAAVPLLCMGKYSCLQEELLETRGKESVNFSFPENPKGVCSQSRVSAPLVRAKLSEEQSLTVTSEAPCRWNVVWWNSAAHSKCESLAAIKGRGGSKCDSFHQ